MDKKKLVSSVERSSDGLWCVREIFTVGLAISSSLTSLAVWRTKRFRTLYNILTMYKLIVDKLSIDLLFSLFMPSSFEMGRFRV